MTVPHRGLLREITDAEVETFERDGVVCLTGALPPSFVADVAAAIDAVIPELADLTAMAGEGPPGDEPGGRFLAGTDHWQALVGFRTASGPGSPLAAIAARLLRSERVFLYEDSVLVKEPRSLQPTRWHQDLGYFHVDGGQLCTAWMPLDPVRARSGGLRFLAGSHLDPTEYRPTLFVTDDPLPGTEGADITEMDEGAYPTMSFDMRPGDVTFHHARLVHSAGPNLTPNQSRRAYSVRYCGDDAVFRYRPGAPLKRAQRGLVDGSPIGDGAHPCVWPAPNLRG